METSPSSSKRVILFALAATAFAVGGFALFKHRAGLHPASVATQAPGAAAATEPAKAVAQPSTATPQKAAPLPSAEVVSLPAQPTATAEKKPATADAVPAKPMPADKASPLGSGELGTSVLAARALLKIGKTADALELIHTRLQNSPTATADEKAAAAVIEGRALLTQNKVADAKQKFEPLALTASNTETGNDALLGNLWCQAGALNKCRDSELEQVRGGPDSWGQATASLEEARRTEEAAAGSPEALEKARVLYQHAFDSGKLDGDEMTQCVTRLTELANKLILDPKVACASPKAVFHKVESGDSVEKIARRYKVNTGQLKRVNRLNDKLIVRLGQNIKVLPGDVVYKVDRTRLTGTLYIDGVFIRQYPVGIGPGNATPPGTFTIENKVMNPDWWYDGKKVPFGDPANILGTRWMGFANTGDNSSAGLGVHGTAFPQSVPGRESKGCVRMHNQDVEELYDFMPQGGKVEIAN